MKFYIDIGHKNGDPGAVNGTFIEHQINTVVGSSMEKELIAGGHTVLVEPGRLEIGASARAANAWGADILISVHHNAGGGDRGEVIYSIRPGSSKLADTVAAGLRAAGQTNVRTYTKINETSGLDYFGILRMSNCPAVIIEPCFIDNATDRQLIDTLIKQKNLGIIIARELMDVYGRKEAVKQVETVAPSMGVVKVVTENQTFNALVIDGTTYIPLRSFAESEGFVVGWDDAAKTVTIKKGV